MVRRIVACGGQQLLFPALTAYLFGFARRPRPKVLFLGTASGDGAGYLLTFYQAMAGVDCEPSHLALFDRVVDDIDTVVRSQDVVIVGGGNTANMLAIWRLHGVELALRAAYASGTVLSGWSAGCLCWFEGGITDSSLRTSARSVTAWASSREARVRTTTRRRRAVRCTRVRSRPAWRRVSRSRTAWRRATTTSASSRWSARGPTDERSMSTPEVNARSRSGCSGRGQSGSLDAYFVIQGRCHCPGCRSFQGSGSPSGRGPP